MSNTENDRNRAAPDAANASSPETDSQRLSLEPTRHTIRRTVTILIVLLIVFVVIAITGIIPRQHARAALRKETDSMAVPTVSVIQPKSGAPMQEIILPGTIQAYQDAPIYARTNGYLKSWSHDIGSHVRKGELLAVIESPEIDRQVDQARAAVATAKANLGLARVTARRYEGLRGTEAVSKQSIDTATQTESAQTASLAVAQQTLNQMLAMQSFERVYAPFSGIVTARNTDIGQLVDSGSNGGTGSSGHVRRQRDNHQCQHAAGIVPRVQHAHRPHIHSGARHVRSGGSSWRGNGHRRVFLPRPDLPRKNRTHREFSGPDNAYHDGRS